MFILPLLFLLLVIWLLCRPTRRSRRLMDSPPPSQPHDEPTEHLEETFRVATAGEEEDGTVCKIRVTVQQEVFTPPLPTGTYYKLIFSGICAANFSNIWYCFDSCYTATSRSHNYTDRHGALQLDGKEVFGLPLEADRALHQYVFPYRATGGRLSVLLESPIRNLWKASEIKDDIHLTVVALSRAEVLRLGLDVEERQREAEARRMIEKLEAQARELAVATYPELHLLEPDQRLQHAKQHHTQISTNLKDMWVAQYREVLADEQLRTILEEQHPHVMPVLLARAEVLALCERIPADEQLAEAKQAEERRARTRADRIAELVLMYREFEHYESDEWIAGYVAVRKHSDELLEEWREILEKNRDFHKDQTFIDELNTCSPGTYRRATWQVRALALADKLTARRRLSAEEKEAKILRFRQRMLDRLNVQAEDEIAKKLQRFESLRRLREQAEDLGIDEDRIDQLEQELLGDLDPDDEDHSNGFRQV